MDAEIIKIIIDMGVPGLLGVGVYYLSKMVNNLVTRAMDSVDRLTDKLETLIDTVRAAEAKNAERDVSHMQRIENMFGAVSKEVDRMASTFDRLEGGVIRNSDSIKALEITFLEKITAEGQIIRHELKNDFARSQLRSIADAKRAQKDALGGVKDVD
jgi:hypothetical protein